MANQWFRMYQEFANDAKVQMMSEPEQRRLVMLFCLRCNGNVTLHDEEVTFQLRISNEEWAKTKALFIKKGFIDSGNKILNWEKRQFTSDSSSARVARHRERMKQACNVTVTPPEQNRTEQIHNRTKTEKIKACADPIGSPPAQKQKIIISLPLNKTDTFHDVVESDVAEYLEIYPAVDVMQELRNMLGWIKANPTKRKTAGGIKKFINGWLAKEQNNPKQARTGVSQINPNHPSDRKTVNGVDYVQLGDGRWTKVFGK